MSNSPRKKRCSKEVNDEKGINNLPDSIICHILSFLETKDSIKTCVFSKRWKSLWKYVPSLCFKFEHPYHYHKNSFIKLKDKVEFEGLASMSLLKHKCQTLDKFCLCIQSGYHEVVGEYEQEVNKFNYVSAWLSTVIMRNVRVLDLNFVSTADSTLSSSIFYSSKSLEILKLKGNWLVNPGFVCLPRLECVNLEGVKYGGSDSVKRLIGGCPVLKSLYVERNCYHDNVHVFTVTSNTLKSLTIKAYSSNIGERNVDLKLEINAPSLTYLSLFDSLSKDISFGSSLTELVELHLFDDNDIEVVNQDCKSVLALISTCYNLKTLVIGTHENLIKRLAVSRVIPLNLRELNLTSFKLDWVTLLRLLHKTNHLQVLQFQPLDGSFEEDRTAPRCLTSSLVRICILEDEEDLESNQMAALVKYILKYGGILKRLEIYKTLSVEILQQILTFSRKSSACQVQAKSLYDYYY